MVINWKNKYLVTFEKKKPQRWIQVYDVVIAVSCGLVQSVTKFDEKRRRFFCVKIVKWGYQEQCFAYETLINYCLWIDVTINRQKLYS